MPESSLYATMLFTIIVRFARAILPADHDSAAPITDDGIPGDDYSVGSRVHLDSPSVALVEHEVVGEQMILTSM